MSSFGYGGTNGHVIVESIETLYPWYKHARAKTEAPYDRSSKKPFLLCFSAHDKITLSRNVKAIGDVASNYYLIDLAHTLNLHRTILSHRAFTVAYEGREAEAFASNALQIGAPSTKAKSVGFLFTGQGVSFRVLDEQRGYQSNNFAGTMGRHGKDCSPGIPCHYGRYSEARPCA